MVIFGIKITQKVWVRAVRIFFRREQRWSADPMFFLGSQIGVSTVFAQLIRHCGEIEFRDFDQIGTQIGFFGT